MLWLEEEDDAVGDERELNLSPLVTGEDLSLSLFRSLYLSLSLSWPYSSDCKSRSVSTRCRFPSLRLDSL